MKNQFAKLFDLEDHQVLITKDEDEDAKEFSITQTTQIDGCDPSASLFFTNQDIRDSAFDSYNKEAAQRFLDSMIELLGPSTDTPQ